ncbi:MAG: OmpA family protein [Thermodesulfobacteriota bacterium]
MKTNQNRLMRLLFLPLLLLMMGPAGCSRKNMVVLMPEKDGSKSGIVVSNQAGSVEIDSPYHATRVQGANSPPDPAAAVDQQEIQAVFGQALAVQPEPPVHFILYFESVSTTLTPESLKTLPTIVETIHARDSVDVGIVGHTDTAGDKDYNRRLSTRRAEAVGQLLVERGVRTECLEISSHGEENPIVVTADDVNEPRNRRVEVVVR